MLVHQVIKWKELSRCNSTKAKRPRKRATAPTQNLEKLTETNTLLFSWQSLTALKEDIISVVEQDWQKKWIHKKHYLPMIYSLAGQSTCITWQLWAQLKNTTQFVLYSRKQFDKAKLKGLPHINYMLMKQTSAAFLSFLCSLWLTFWTSEPPRFLDLDGAHKTIKWKGPRLN